MSGFLFWFGVTAIILGWVVMAIELRRSIADKEDTAGPGAE